MKKHFILSVKAAIAALFLLIISVSQAATQSAQPNILFIFIDDIGWGDLSCYGSPVKDKQGKVITPNIDKFASEGIRFTQGYVAAPICSPSRVGVLTGIEPCRYAIYSFLDNKAANASRNMADWLQDDTVSAPHLFKQAGYVTGQFGKWHMGNGRDVNNAPPPSNYGFDQSMVAFEGNGDRLLYWNDNGSKYGLSQQNEDATVGTYEYCYFYQAPSNQANAAISFITNAVHEGKPFYVHVPFNDTHSPYNVAPGHENDFDHITSDTTGKLFLAELHNLDSEIGRIIKTIDDLGIATNTLIMVIGDNGAPNDSLENLLNRNGGLRGGKGNLYEGGFREPFMIRWPGVVPAGVVNSNTVVSTLDLLPTYCSFAKIPLPNAPFAGEDMSDVFRGSSRARQRPLFWEYGTVSALSPGSPKLAVRDGGYKFMRNPDGTKRELYQLPQDHAEATNLVNNPVFTNVVTNLETKLMTWYDEVVLGNVGETYECGGSSNFLGMAIADSYDVTSGDSPDSGLDSNAGGNYEIASRLTGGAASSITGYRLGGAGGPSPRQASDFSITENRLTIAPRNGNGRIEFSEDGTSGFNFGNFLAGHSYELSVQMNISMVGSSYSQRMSLSLSDASNEPVGNVDLGLQIGSDGAGGIAVFKRIEAGAAPGGSAMNNKILSGLPIGTPATLTLRVNDYNANVSDYNSTYEILVNGTSVSSGSFRFNNSTSDRYLIFDIAAHEGPVYYDDLKLNVTGGASAPAFCRKPVLSVSEVHGEPMPKLRLYWTAQPGLVVHPEISTNLSQWTPMTNSTGGMIRVTTGHGSIQWLEVPAPDSGAQGTFVRLVTE